MHCEFADPGAVALGEWVGLTEAYANATLAKQRLIEDAGLTHISELLGYVRSELSALASLVECQAADPALLSMTEPGEVEKAAEAVIAELDGEMFE